MLFNAITFGLCCVCSFIAYNQHAICALFNFFIKFGSLLRWDNFFCPATLGTKQSWPSKFWLKFLTRYVSCPTVRQTLEPFPVQTGLFFILSPNFLYQDIQKMETTFIFNFGHVNGRKNTHYRPLLLGNCGKFIKTILYVIKI